MKTNDFEKSSGRIWHGLCHEPSSLYDFLQDHFTLTREHVSERVELGCVYLNKKRQMQNIDLQINDYIRFHHDPRRFDNNWLQLEHLLAETQDFFIVNKPAGLPVHATLDNSRENLLEALRLKTAKNTYVTHRLDVGTSGIIVVAKSIQFQKQFNLWMQNQKVRKFYQAFVEGFCQRNGLVTHFMEPSPRAPKTVSLLPTKGWQACLLHLTSEPRTPAHEELNITSVQIELITGRTHQIRAQMANLGHPILGDLIYGASWSLPQHNKKQERECIALHSYQLQMNDISTLWKARPCDSNPYFEWWVKRVAFPRSPH